MKAKSIGRIIDFVCFKLIAAHRLKADYEGIEMYIGQGLIPNSENCNFLDLVEGEFVEVDLSTKSIEELKPLVRKVESAI